MTNLSIALHVLHILFGAFWLGSLLYTELVAWPQLRKAGQLPAVQGALRTVHVRRQIGIPIIGTVLTGYARGATDGVFDRLFEPYGVMFLLSAIVAIAMVVWWISFPTRDRKIGWRLFYSSFGLIFVLMVGMRVHAPH